MVYCPTAEEDCNLKFLLDMFKVSPEITQDIINEGISVVTSRSAISPTTHTIESVSHVCGIDLKKQIEQTRVKCGNANTVSGLKVCMLFEMEDLCPNVYKGKGGQVIERDWEDFWKNLSKTSEQFMKLGESGNL